MMDVRKIKTLRISGPQGGLNVEVRGARGAPVLLVHGNGGRGRQWEPQLAAFGTRHRAVALDLRGMGGSAAPRNGDFSIGGFAEDVVAVADALALSRFLLVGHSLGGQVAAACAALVPERLLGVVLVDQGGDLRDDSEADRAALIRGLAPASFAAFSRRAMETCLKGAKPQVVAQVLGDLKATPPAHFAGAVLRSYSGPRLHIHSDFLAAQNLAPIHGQVPGMAAVRVGDCSHWVHLDQPEVFNDLVGGWHPLLKVRAGAEP